jgi:hypothetical protein
MKLQYYHEAIDTYGKCLPQCVDKEAVNRQMRQAEAALRSVASPDITSNDARLAEAAKRILTCFPEIDAPLYIFSYVSREERLRLSSEHIGWEGRGVPTVNNQSAEIFSRTRNKVYVLFPKEHLDDKAFTECVLVGVLAHEFSHWVLNSDLWSPSFLKYLDVEIRQIVADEVSHVLLAGGENEGYGDSEVLADIFASSRGFTYELAQARAWLEIGREDTLSHGLPSGMLKGFWHIT